MLSGDLVDLLPSWRDKPALLVFVLKEICVCAQRYGSYLRVPGDPERSTVKDMATLFFSYSHRDEALRDQLETHLAMLKRQRFIEAWHDRRITAGESFDETISANLERADVVLLLVSPDFLASDYCYEREMRRAMDRHEAGNCIVIPVILRPCDWHGAPFGNLLAAPTDGVPVTRWPDIDTAFLDVTKAIKGALRQTGKAAEGTVQRDSSPAASEPGGKVTAKVRSSNLRVAKRFTEQDKESFLHDTFEYIAKYFENSLNELADRNQDIEGRFRRIDANRFTAVVYRNGEAASRCSITLGGGFGSGISYSNDDSARHNSFNESLSVEHDDQTLFLQLLGMSTLHRTDEKRKLTPNGAAEYYWEMFIDPLQRKPR